MRAAQAAIILSLLAVACFATAEPATESKRALLAAETDLATETAVDGGRGLLCFGGSCVRPLSKTQAHKTPTAPKITRKSFNRNFPKRALLAAETELAVETLAEASRKLLCFGGSCVRPIARTQSHKTPVAPKLSRKNFNRNFPKRALLAAETELATETTVDSGRKLLCFGGSCVRPIARTQSHKTPTAPKISRKNFNRNFPKRALLAAETELATETTVDSGRKLLCFGGSCVRPLSKTQAHKTPTAPKISRKNFNRSFPKRALLAAETELAIEAIAESSRKLLCFGGSCVRPLSKTQAHKTPTAPKITKKNFNRNFPKRA